MPMQAGNVRREILKLGLRLVLGAGLLVALVSLLGYYFRPELEGMGRAFLHRFGYLGIAAGTYIADGLHCPVPPHFYMFASIVSGWSALWTIVAVCAGSLLGGLTAYAIAHRASQLRFFKRLLDRTKQRVDWLFKRFRYWAVAVGSLTPIPYPFLCYVAGAYRMPPKVFVALSMFRVPKVIVYYYLVKLGWMRGGD